MTDTFTNLVGTIIPTEIEFVAIDFKQQRNTEKENQFQSDHE